MRSSILFSLAIGLLAVEQAVAGPCSHSARPSSTVATSSTPSTTPTEPVGSSTSAEASSTTSAESVESSTSTEVSSSTTSAESVGSSTSTEVSSSTSSIPASNPTFTILAGGSPLQDGGGRNGIYIFNPTRSDISTHTASIDPDTGHVIFSSGWHWVAQYTMVPNYPALLLNGADGDNTNYPAITCTVGTDLIISCSAPAGGCNDDFLDPVCGPTSGTWGQFCSKYQSVFGDVLYIFSSCPAGFTPVTLYAQVV
ncbi:hypothetical protein BGZ61DRAFT_467265 [Ilyonectria robusta]|uniref:uncharacterized protein n=1 Tax=Ilyonectria robusta TaxID=1079257 RepID=UPI001E8DAFE7|nr:uncharacterized protein BGZ61DRAFT_467265 [Ilyonectria robusta]KAH8654883.1 hypothetical protein BGZ61DRAFT_467265 [Ilyonectria robusta]